MKLLKSYIVAIALFGLTTRASCANPDLAHSCSSTFGYGNGIATLSMSEEKFGGAEIIEDDAREGNIRQLDVGNVKEFAVNKSLEGKKPPRLLNLSQKTCSSCKPN